MKTLHNFMIDTRSLVRPWFLIWGKKFYEEPMRLGAAKIVHRIMGDSSPIEDLHGAELAIMESVMVKTITDTAMDALKALHAKKHPTQADRWMRKIQNVAVRVENAKDYRRFNVRVFLYDECMGHLPGYELADRIFDFRPGATVREIDNGNT